MYWLCYDNDDPRVARIVYAAIAPDRFDNVYGYETEHEAVESLHEALETFYAEHFGEGE